MKRLAFASTSLLCCLAIAPAAFAQAAKSTAAAPKTTAAKKDATPAVAPAPAPPSPELLKARMRPPVKGTAYIEIIKGTSKRVGDEIVTVTRVKNVSDAPIAGLRIDEWWYAGGQQVSAGDARLRQPLAPGEIVEMTTKSPVKRDMSGGSQLQFTHANGGIKPKAVKKFGEADDAKKPAAPPAKKK
jgi:hypothetical protein